MLAICIYQVNVWYCIFGCVELYNVFKNPSIPLYSLASVSMPHASDRWVILDKFHFSILHLEPVLNDQLIYHMVRAPLQQMGGLNDWDKE